MKRTLALFLALAMLLSTTASALAYMDGTGIPGNWPAPVACNHSYYLADTIINSSARKDCRILVLDSLQKTSLQDYENGVTYLSVMKANLDVLAQALS